MTRLPAQPLPERPNVWRTAAYFSAYLVSRIVPRPVGHWIADTASAAAYLLKRRERALVQNNLSALIRPSRSPEEIARAVRAVYDRFGRSCVDLLYETRSRDLPLLPDLQIIHLSALDRALARGKGVILAGAHTGSWDLGAMALASRGYPLSVVAAYAPAAGVPGLYRRQRERVGLDVIDARGGLIKCVRVLKHGGILGIMTDRAAGTRGTPGLFFGRPALLPSGAARLAALMGSPILGATLRRAADGTPVLKFWERDELTADSRRPVEALQTAVVSLAESMIAEAPEEWFCFEDAWKKNS